MAKFQVPSDVNVNDFFEKYELNINDYGFDFSRRAESLTLREFIDLSNITAQKIKLD